MKYFFSVLLVLNSVYAIAQEEVTSKLWRWGVGGVYRPYEPGLTTGVHAAVFNGKHIFTGGIYSSYNFEKEDFIEPQLNLSYQWLILRREIPITPLLITTMSITNDFQGRGATTLSFGFGVGVNAYIFKCIDIGWYGNVGPAHFLENFDGESVEGNVQSFIYANYYF